jgi:tetratricopeptide (TPR) repeat protein
MDDEVVGTWQLDPATRSALRLEQVRKTLARGDFDLAALEAEELLDEEPDHVEALLLLGQAEIELGDAQTAALALSRYLDLVGAPTANALSSLAAARFHMCDLVGAIELAREATRLDPSIATAHWVLAMSLERMPGQSTSAAQAFAAAHQLAPETCPFPLTLDSPQWELAVGQALEQIHPALREFWNGVEVRLSELPDLRTLRAAHPPMTPATTGLYVGEPPVDADPWSQRPEALRLYLRNLARAVDAPALVERIADVLEHEALDWLGVSFEMLDAPAE